FAVGTEYDGSSPAIAIYNPEVDSPEFRNNHTVIAMVLADMPHLVSSIVSDLANSGRAIRRVHHPIITVTGSSDAESIVSPAEAPALSAATASLPKASEPAASDSDSAPPQSWTRVQTDQVPQADCAG